jgi:hypothetical protein
MNKDLPELYGHYLPSAFGRTADLSPMTHGTVSHDEITDCRLAKSG